MADTLNRTTAYAVCLAVALTKHNANAAPHHAKQILKAMTAKGVVDEEVPEIHGTQVPPELIERIDALTFDSDRRACMYVIAEALHSWHFIHDAIIEALKPLAIQSAQVPTDEANELNEQAWAKLAVQGQEEVQDGVDPQV